ncbi:hypothetical protein AB0G06_44155, partial [Nonomuraea dietziae]|uniref:hypothetical protein n=1 Tax=Nonomuraea dietziae TaxID=65515 RepID=UPI0033C1E0E3
MAMVRARGRERVLGRSRFGLGRTGLSRWIAGTATAVVIALLPSFLSMEAMAVTSDPAPSRLDIPGSPTPGSSTVVPTQSSGSAEGLPHLVDPGTTQPDGIGRPDDGKRPKGSLPLEKAPVVSDKPATDGLNDPPPLPWQEPGSSPQTDGLNKVSAPSSNVVVRRGAAQAAASLPVVSGVTATPGQAVTGLWTFPSTQPSFIAYGADPESRTLRLEAQVEHDPSVSAQGSGLIWSGSGDLSSSGCSTSSKCWLQTPTVTSGKLRDGWLIRWRVRVTTSSGVVGKWSGWQAGRVDTSKPVVSDLNMSPGQLTSGLWALPSTQPSFIAYGADPESRTLRLEAQVEHDPSAAGQGSGLIWSGSGDLSSSGCSTSSKCWLQTPTVTSGKLRDGWLIRWRVRTSTSAGVAGPWSEWQVARVDTSKPVVSDLAASQGRLTSGLWALPSAQPYFSAYGADPESRTLRLEAQVEHDPSVSAQGSGLI